VLKIPLNNPNKTIPKIENKQTPEIKHYDHVEELSESYDKLS
jgi:hypothetical protein